MTHLLTILLNLPTCPGKIAISSLPSSSLTTAAILLLTKLNGEPLVVNKHSLANSNLSPLNQIILHQDIVILKQCTLPLIGNFLSE